MENTEFLGPLGVGDVVSAGFRIYFQHRKIYSQVALVAALWMSLPITVLILGSGIVASLGAAGATGLAVLLGVILGIGFIYLFLWAWAKSALNGAVIARLVFGELTQNPETVEEARRKLRSRMWSFVRLGIVLFLIFVFVQLGLSLVQGLVVVPVIAILGTGAIVAIINGIVSLLAMGGYYWVYARLCLPDIALGVEDRALGTGGSLDRGWQLTQGSAWRVSLVMLVGGVVTLPFFFLAFVPSIIGVIFQSANPENPAGPGTLASVVTALGLILTLFLLILVILSSIAFWQSIKTVLYYDLCMRREGLDLRLTGRSTQDPALTTEMGFFPVPETSTASRRGSPSKKSTNPSLDPRWAEAISSLNGENGGGNSGPGRGYSSNGNGDRGLNNDLHLGEREDGTSGHNGTYDDQDYWQNHGKSTPDNPPDLEDLGIYETPDLNSSPDSSYRYEYQDDTATPPPDRAIPSWFTPSPPAQTIAPQLQQHPGLGQMTGRDFEELEEYLQIRATLPKGDRKTMALALAKRLKATIELDSLPAKMTAETFLEALYLARRSPS